MPELRKDPITREWVVIASGEAGRVLEFTAAVRRAPLTAPSQPCPFCPGHEDLSGPELLAYRPPSTGPDTPGWRVRVVPGRSAGVGNGGPSGHPALQDPEVLQDRREGGPRDHPKGGDPSLRSGQALGRHDYLPVRPTLKGRSHGPEGLYDTMQAVGAQEIVVETPRHEASLADLEVAQVEDVLWVIRERAEVLGGPDWVRYVSVSRNHGLEAAPAHPRSQLLAAPVVPQGAWDYARGLREYYDYRGRCAICHIIEGEAGARERVVYQNRAWVTLAPYASGRPFELWLLPRRHAPGIGQVEALEMRHLAAALRDALLRLKVALDDPPYHCQWLMAPRHLEGMDHVHWSIAITPHLIVSGAQELGGELRLNPVPPEETARLLRDAIAPTLEVAAGRR
jgi:UDPglucose--hexose-1-phosphate uridylyltransferase